MGPLRFGRSSYLLEILLSKAFAASDCSKAANPKAKACRRVAAPSDLVTRESKSNFLVLRFVSTKALLLSNDPITSSTASDCLKILMVNISIKESQKRSPEMEESRDLDRVTYVSHVSRSFLKLMPKIDRRRYRRASRNSIFRG